MFCVLFALQVEWFVFPILLVLHVVQHGTLPTIHLSVARYTGDLQLILAFLQMFEVRVGFTG